MRGRQQYYLTIGCASNWPGLAPPPRRDMPIFRGREWAIWDYVQPSCGPRGMSRGGVGERGACPALARAAGHAQWSVGRGGVGMPIYCARDGGAGEVGSARGLCPALVPAAGHVPWSGGGAWDMPYFAGRTGLMWDHVQHSHEGRGMPPGKPQTGRGGGPIGRSWKVQVF